MVSAYDALKYKVVWFWDGPVRVLIAGGQLDGELGLCSVELIAFFTLI